MHFNANLRREVDTRKADQQEKIKITYPKFKNGEATVRNVRVTPNFGEFFFHESFTKSFNLTNLFHRNSKSCQLTMCCHPLLNTNGGDKILQSAMRVINQIVNVNLYVGAF